MEKKEIKLMSKRAARKQLRAMYTKSKLIALKSCFETGSMTPAEVHERVTQIMRSRLSDDDRKSAKALLLQTGVHK